jgi:hypothetical protein
MGLGYRAKFICKSSQASPPPPAPPPPGSQAAAPRDRGRVSASVTGATSCVLHTPALHRLTAAAGASPAVEPAQTVAANGGRGWLERLRAAPHEEARTALETLCGVGSKVPRPRRTCAYRPPHMQWVAHIHLTPRTPRRPAHPPACASCDGAPAGQVADCVCLL